MTPKQLFIPNNKLSIVCLVCNCFVPTDILKNLKNLSHSLLVSDNNMKALTKQKTIIQSELKYQTLKELLVFVPTDVSKLR